jgi:nucleotide-binding universal stress UspA family protein
MTAAQKTILAATDFSPGSDDALDRAVDLAKRMGAALEIFHVVEIGTEPFPFGLLDSKDGGDFFAYIARQLETRAERARRAGVPCTTKSLDGSPAPEIVGRARDLGADLIVVGTQGRAGLSHALFGSVAEHVVRRADRPVLIVPFSKRAA